MKLNIFIPKNNDSFSKLGIPAGTAFVEQVRESSEEYLYCYIEGNLYGAENLVTFRDKAICAAGRLVENYPTIAKSLFKRDDMLHVGYLDYEIKHLHFYDNSAVKARFKEWTCAEA